MKGYYLFFVTLLKERCSNENGGKVVKRFTQFQLFHKTTKLQTKTSILVLCILLQWHIAAHSNLADHVNLYH